MDNESEIIPRRCFVISPIGDEGSAIREHADDVFDFIISPAMRECSLEAIRSDRLNEPGRISVSMFQHIFSDDLCIAVLTGHNPNVFYELALAQAAARPVIMMMEKDHVLPFDIQDMRCIYYDLRPRSIHNGVYLRELVNHVEAIRSNGWNGEFPFGDRSPLGVSVQARPPVNMIERTVDVNTSDRYLDLLKSATHSFDIVGIALNSWSRVRHARVELRKQAAAGCRIRIAVVDPDNPALMHMIGANELGSIDQVRHSIAKMIAFFRDCVGEEENMEFRTLKRGCLFARLHIADLTALYDPYFFSESNDFTPIWEVDRRTQLYSLCSREFEAIWGANK